MVCGSVVAVELRDCVYFDLPLCRHDGVEEPRGDTTTLRSYHHVVEPTSTTLACRKRQTGGVVPDLILNVGRTHTTPRCARSATTTPRSQTKIRCRKCSALDAKTFKFQFTPRTLACPSRAQAGTRASHFEASTCQTLHKKHLITSTQS